MFLFSFHIDKMDKRDELAATSVVQCNSLSISIVHWKIEEMGKVTDFLFEWKHEYILIYNNQGELIHFHNQSFTLDCMSKSMNEFDSGKGIYFANNISKKASNWLILRPSGMDQSEARTY